MNPWKARIGCTSAVTLQLFISCLIVRLFFKDRRFSTRSWRDIYVLQTSYLDCTTLDIISLCIYLHIYIHANALDGRYIRFLSYGLWKRVDRDTDTSDREENSVSVFKAVISNIPEEGGREFKWNINIPMPTALQLTRLKFWAVTLRQLWVMQSL
jgi:hypothetical protein